MSKTAFDVQGLSLVAMVDIGMQLYTYIYNLCTHTFMYVTILCFFLLLFDHGTGLDQHHSQQALLIYNEQMGSCEKFCLLFCMVYLELYRKFPILKNELKRHFTKVHNIENEAYHNFLFHMLLTCSSCSAKVEIREQVILSQ